VGPRTVLAAVVKREITSPRRESNPIFSEIPDLNSVEFGIGDQVFLLSD
jgi:hypothetical protein